MSQSADQYARVSQYNIDLINTQKELERGKTEK